MAYFIFNPIENLTGTLFKIAENQNDLNNLNIISSNYKIIEDSQGNFDLVKYGNKLPEKYNNNVITYVDQTNLIKDKIQLENYIINFKRQLKEFTDNNPNHPLFSRWNNYYTQLNNLNLDNITYPLDKSLEQYFSDLGQPSLNPLQLP